MPGVYLSYPFCAQKCSFCNFASGVEPAELESRYTEAILAEIAAHKWKWTPDTVYIGGGTPSRLLPGDLRRILDALPGRHWREVTIEAAPGSLTPEGVEAWVSSGVNRVSLGVQSFITKELAQTGRKHNAAVVEADCKLLRDTGIANINIDLIAGLPWQTRESWQQSLDAVERLGPPHVSVYLFEVDEDSRLGLEILNNGSRYSAGAVPDSDVMAEFYETAVDRLHGTGIERYEISNFAKPGFESAHNLKYWLLDPYVGFGVDAHSYDGRLRSGNVDKTSDYVRRMELGESVVVERTAAVHEEEKFFVGLRLTRGVEVTTEDRELHGETLTRLSEAGLITDDGGRIALTRRGVLFSNDVFSEFIQLQQEI